MASPLLSDANRDAAEAWRHRGRSAFTSTQPPTRDSLAEAVRLLSKSRSLHPLDGIDDELEAVQRHLDMASVRSAQQQADARPAPETAGGGPSGAPPPRPAPAAPAAAAADLAAVPPDGGCADTEVSRVLESSDHYTSLLIERSASDGELKKAYHRMSRAVHPDKCSDSRATQAFQKLQSAFATLRDAAKRAIYDASLLAGAGAPRRPTAQPRPPAARAPNPTAEAYEAERQRRAAEARAQAEEQARVAAAEAARQAAEALQRARDLAAEGQAEAVRVNLAIRLERLCELFVLFYPTTCSTRSGAHASVLSHGYTQYTPRLWGQSLHGTETGCEHSVFGGVCCFLHPTTLELIFGSRGSVSFSFCPTSIPNDSGGQFLHWPETVYELSV
jgi:hypothetical protein